jgi:hypothetical protein
LQQEPANQHIGNAYAKYITSFEFFKKGQGLASSWPSTSCSLVVYLEHAKLN